MHPNALEQAAMEGESPVAKTLVRVYSWASTVQVTGFHRVGLLESAASSGWYTSSKAKYGHETDSEQVP